MTINRSATRAGALSALRYVEVETSRFCNRRCSWCPNGPSGARRVQELMQWTLFDKIVTELGSLNYSGFFAFHNFNEPLANPRLFEEIARLRQAIPEAKPAIYTNGDLLNSGGLHRMLGLGVAYVRVTRYPHRATVAPRYDALHRFLGQAGIAEEYEWRFESVRQGLAAIWEDRSAGVKVEVIRPSIVTYNDRGGTAIVPHADSLRTAPCLMTTTSASIDFRGALKMCCNVIPDTADDHEQYVVGNVSESTLTELWTGARMDDWRARHSVADWQKSPACRTCVQALPETRQ
jgi:hypothetical protein